MESKDAIEFAIRAFDIMGIKYDKYNKKTNPLQYYVDKLNNALILPIDSTEMAILRISREIAEEIQKSDLDTKKIEKLLKDLDFEVTYLPFD